MVLCQLQTDWQLLLALKMAKGAHEPLEADKALSLQPATKQGHRSYKHKELTTANSLNEIKRDLP